MSVAALFFLLGCNGGDKPTPAESDDTIAGGDTVLDDTVPVDSETAHDTTDTSDDTAVDSDTDTGEPPAPIVPRVILFIGDGMGFQHVAGGGLYAYGAEGTLTMEGLPYQGQIRTASFTGVTDSAAAGTALATGNKTWNAVLGLDKNGLPVANLVEEAKALGMKTGVVTRDALTGATPAAFLVHQEDRYEPDAIATEEAVNLPDVLLGGGARTLSPLIDASLVELVTTQTELLAATNDGRTLVGLFDDDTMPFVADHAAEDPTLAEMTTTALTFLQDSPNGFFLMVEGARIDHASHANSDDRVHPETAAFDEAIAAAVDWSKTLDDPDTVTLLVTADHECGGIQVDPTDAVAGAIPPTTWRWYAHTNADVPVFAMGPKAEAIDGQRLDQLWVHSILDAAINQTDVVPPEVPRLADGYTEDLGDVVTTQTWDTSFGAGYNQLDDLRATADADGIWIGVDGVFQNKNTAAIVLLDLDYGAGTGMGVDGFLLDDTDGEMDTLLSTLQVTTSLTGLGFDAAVVTIGAEEIGYDHLLDVAGMRGLHDPYGDVDDIWWLHTVTNFDYGNLSGDDVATDAGPTGDTEGGWEIQIPWNELYSAGLPTEGLNIGINVVLVSEDGTYASNQALPALESDTEPGTGPITLSSTVLLSVDSAGDATGDAVEVR